MNYWSGLKFVKSESVKLFIYNIYLAVLQQTFLAAFVL